MQTSATTHPPEPIQIPDADLSYALLGPGKAIADLSLRVRRLAPHLRTVLLSGAQDCGQEAIARLLLVCSSHPHRSFVTIHSSEAESRLSSPKRSGEQPSGVFLFLPDADRLSMTAQQRVLDLCKIRRSDRVTIAAAATDDLQTLVRLKRYLPELADVLGSVCIRVPALKERVEDLPMLLNQVLHLRCQARQRAVPQISATFLQAAMDYDWPGNFAAFSNIVDYLLDNESDKDGLDLAEWELALKAQQMPEPISRSAGPGDLATVVHEHIYAVLQACEGNKARAAKVLGVSRSTLYRLTADAKEHHGLHLVQRTSPKG